MPERMPKRILFVVDVPSLFAGTLSQLLPSSLSHALFNWQVLTEWSHRYGSGDTMVLRRFWTTASWAHDNPVEMEELHEAGIARVSPAFSRGSGDHPVVRFCKHEARQGLLEHIVVITNNNTSVVVPLQKLQEDNPGLFLTVVCLPSFYRKAVLAAVSRHCAFVDLSRVEEGARPFLAYPLERRFRKHRRLKVSLRPSPQGRPLRHLCLSTGLAKDTDDWFHLFPRRKVNRRPV